MTAITIEFLTQLKAAAGCDGMDVDTGDPIAVSALLERIAREHSSVRTMLLDDDGRPWGWLMIAIDGAMVARGSDPPVSPGSTLVIGTPVSGG